MYMLPVIGLSILCFFGSIMSNPVENVEENKKAVEMISNAAAQFSLELLKTIGEKHEGNLILSPVSVDMVLAMATYGADGNTAVQMKNVLHLPDQEVSSERGYQNLVDQFNNVKDVELHLANKMFVDQSFPVKESYQKFTEEYFRSTTRQVNFQNAPEAAEAINSFCKEHTNNRITKLIDTKDVDPSTAMFLVNAAYFKGVWNEKFDSKATHEMPFHVDENTVKNVSMMYQKAQFNYGESSELEATFIEIPYKGKELSMAVFLPNANTGLEQLLQKLTKTNIGEVLKNGSEVDVMLHLPKFKIESTMQLSEPLKKIGLTELFSDSANFSKISDVSVKVSKVVQKAFIEVNEEGSEAAAATGMGVVFLSLPLPPVLMQVDRPFVYAIIHKSSSVPIFLGFVRMPSV